MGISGNTGLFIAYWKYFYYKKWYKCNNSYVNECNFEEVNSNSPYFLNLREKNNLLHNSTFLILN